MPASGDPPHVSQQRVREYLSIQYLRGLAALLVVVYHLGQPLERMGYTGGWPSGLAGGVDIFFVISGFVMWTTTRARSITPGRFWWKRITRIVPLYWLVTTFMLVVLLVVPNVMQTSVFNFHHVVASYLFFPAQNPGKSAMEPLVFPGWTLNYEMFFYFIFGLFLITRPAIRLAGTIAVLVLLVAVGTALSTPTLSVFGFYSSGTMLEFAFGMILGELTFWRAERGLAKPLLAWVLLIGGLCCLVALPSSPNIPRVINRGLPGLAIVLGALSIETSVGIREIRLPHLIGNASYSIYLTQLISMAAFMAAWRKLHLAETPVVMLVFCTLDVAAALLIGCLSYRFLERPLMMVSKGKRRHRAPAAEATTGWESRASEAPGQ